MKLQILSIFSYVKFNKILLIRIADLLSTCDCTGIVVCTHRIFYMKVGPTEGKSEVVSTWRSVIPSQSLLLSLLGHHTHTHTASMKLSTLLPLAVAVGCASAFAPVAVQRPAAFVRHMSEEPSDEGGALVPIKEETVEFTAGILGGVAGFAVGGPVLGAIGAAIANYVSKNDSEASTVVTAVSKSSIQVFNYLTTLDKKYDLLTKAQGSLEDALTKVKGSQTAVDASVVDQIEGALSNTKDKIEEVNNEYDLVGTSVTALGVVGELVEKAIVKAGELNEEYKLTDKAVDALGGAVNKAKQVADDAL